MLYGHKLSWIAIIIILFLYLLFPSGSSTTDGWAYASSIKYGVEIFQPHHLLYNALGLVFSWLPSKVGIEIISSMKVLNALFAFLTLIVIQQLLYSLKLFERQIVIITCLAGVSFSVLRYATENETYIIPLFFALLASLNYLYFITAGRLRYALYAGLWAAISVLFHQIYIFWWFGLFIGFLIGRSKKSVLIYTCISLIAPLAYLLVILVSKGSGWNAITDFIIGDFKENVRLELTGKGILLSIINLFRSFIQVHGYIFNIAKENLLFLIPGIISSGFVLFSFQKFPKISDTNFPQQFSTIHIIIIALQFIFAVVSSGNAEFMVMIPVLVFILIPFFAIKYEKYLVRILIAMAIWNISYGLIPLHYKSQIPETFLCNEALSSQNIIIASNAPLIKNMIYYQTGENDNKNVIESPAYFEIKGKDTGSLEDIIDRSLNDGAIIYTDCLDEVVISRSSLMEGVINKNFFENYKTTLTKSWSLLTGTRSIYRVEKIQ